MVDKESWRKGAVQCAGAARELLADVLVAAQDAENAASTDEARRYAERLTEGLASAASALFAVHQEKVIEYAEVRARMRTAHASLKLAAELLEAKQGTNPLLGDGHRDRVARALALVFAAGGGSSASTPPPRRSSTSLRAVHAPSDPGVRDKPATSVSSPAIELGAIEDARLEELGIDEPESSRRPPPSSVSSPHIQAVEVDAAQLDLPEDELALLSDRTGSSPGAAAGSDEPVVTRAQPAFAAAVATTEDGARAGAALAPDSDRRGSDRVVLEVEVGFVSESNFYAGLSMDVSTGGLFVATWQAHPVGTHVLLSFVLPGGKTVTTPGVVRWVRAAGDDDAPPGMGVAFSGLGPDELSSVEAFCKRRQPMYYDAD